MWFNKKFEFELARSILMALVFQMIPLGSVWAQEGENIVTMPVPNPEMSRFETPEMGEVGFTGDLNLSFPILTVPGRGGLDFPIVLRYHQPIKISQHASWVGLGWELNTGSISCSPVVFPDITLHRYKYMSGNPPVSSYPKTDTQMLDNWNVNTPAGSSRLLFSDHGSINPRDWEFFPTQYQEWKIGTEAGDHEIYSFYMFSEDGTKYWFEQEGRQPARWNQLLNLTNTWDYSHEYIGEWKLTRIWAPGGGFGGIGENNEITIEYEFDENNESMEYSIAKDVDYYEGEGGGPPDPVDMRTLIGFTSVTYPKKITTPTHTALFITSDRYGVDELGPSCEGPDRLLDKNQLPTRVHIHQKRLDRIELWTNDGSGNPKQLIKAVNFTYADAIDERKYTDVSERGELTLKGIEIESHDSSEKIPSYIFDYVDLNPEILTADDFNGTNFNDPLRQNWGHQQDAWGFYSTTQDDYDQGITTAHAWSLQSVTYPTGAKVTYYYGSDEIERADPQYPQYFQWVREGGTRVDSVQVNDGMDNNVIMRYNYDPSNGYSNVEAGIPFLLWLKYEIDDGGYGFLMQIPGDNHNEYIGYKNVTISYRDGSSIKTTYSTSQDELTFTLWNGEVITTPIEFDPHLVVENLNQVNDWPPFRSIVFGSQDYLRGLVKRVEYSDKDTNLVKRDKHCYLPYEVNSFVNGGEPFSDNTVTVYSALAHEMERVVWKDGVNDSIRYDYHDGAYPTLLWYEDHYGKIGEENPEVLGRYTEYTYAISDGEVGQTMQDMHMISQLMRTNKGKLTYFVGNQVEDPVLRTDLWRQETIWGNFGDGSPNLIKPRYETEGSSTELDTILTYEAYDDYGNLIQTTDGNGNKIYYYYGDNDNPFSNDLSEDYLKHAKMTGIIRMKDNSESPNTTNPFSSGTQLANKVLYYTELRDPSDLQMGPPLSSEYDTKQSQPGDNGNALLTEDVLYGYPFLPKSISDNNGNSHTYTYDEFGRLIYEQNATGEYTAAFKYYYSRDDYDVFNSLYPNKITTIRARSRTESDTSMTYFDGLGREIQHLISRGPTGVVITEKMYDHLNRLILETKPGLTSGLNYKPNYVQDSYVPDPGQPIPSDSDVCEYYDSSPGPDAGGYPFTFYQYDDPLGRISVIRPPGIDYHLSHYVENLYEANGVDDGMGDVGEYYAVKTKNEDGVWTEKWTNKFGNIVGEAVDHPDGGGGLDLKTRYEHDALGNLIKVIHPGDDGQVVTTFIYNSRNQVASKNSPDLDQAEQYLYDRNGNLRFVLSPNQAEADSFIYYKYNAQNRLTEVGLIQGVVNFTQTNAHDIDYPPNGSQNKTIKYSYLYDLSGIQNGKGKLCIEYQPDGAGSTNRRIYSYDKEGRVKQVRIGVPGITGDSHADLFVKYSYDRQGNVTELEYPNGNKVTYTYNNLGQISEIGNPTWSNEYAEYKYWPNGLVKTLNLGKPSEGLTGGRGNWGQVVNYNYTIRDWLKTINDGIDLGINDRFGLELYYDDVPNNSYYNGNIAQMTRVISGDGSLTYNFTYDNAERLLNANCDVNSYDVSGVNGPDIIYDERGNIQSLQRGNTNYTYEYLSNTNRLTSISRGGSASVLYHDFNGNMVWDDFKSMGISYDYRNLPMVFDKVPEVGMHERISCLYDAPGNRIRKVYEVLMSDSQNSRLTTIIIPGRFPQNR